LNLLKSKIDSYIITIFSALLMERQLQQVNDSQFKLRRLMSIGIMLSSETDLDRLLEMIVNEAIDFSNADAGSLYIVDDKQLNFVVCQSKTLQSRVGDQNAGKAFKPYPLPLTKKSIAGYVAHTGEVLNIADAYTIAPSAEYSHNKTFDLKNDYHSQSMLILPMKNQHNRIIGVLQLINALDNVGNVIAFNKSDEEIMLCLASQAAVSVSNAQLTRGIHEAQYETITRLAIAAEYKDTDTGQHIKRVSEYSAIMAEELGWGRREIELVRYATPMHDVGKIRIPDAILQKPGRLTPQERKTMEMHSIYGGEILDNPKSEVLAWSQQIALSHHEKYDGTGYPRGLVGAAIPKPCRVVALSDAFDAMINKRCYKPAMAHDKVFSIIREERGNHFDPEVVDAFFNRIDEIMDTHASLQEDIEITVVDTRTKPIF
jgi:HD-GYP domain-containing protein (c-di-GMP phosphodiesterase class II)